MSLLDLARSALPNERKTAATATAATATVANATGTRYRWRVILADGTPFEVCCLPELTTDEIRARYPGATVEALPDSPIARL